MGENVAGAAAEAGPIDLADLLQLDPDVYLRHVGHGSQPRRPAPEPTDAEAPRDQEGRFVTADADLLEPGPAIGEGLVEVARLLHPDAFR